MHACTYSIDFSHADVGDVALSLFRCGLTAITATALTTTLVNNTGLMELRLGGNKISKAMKARVAKVLTLPVWAWAV